MFDLLYEEKTGFSAIRNMLKERCLSDMGKVHVDEIVFQTDFQTIDKATDETDEFRRILLFDNGFPSQDYIDMRTVLSHLRIEGAFIEQEQLIELSASLHTLINAIQFFQEQRQGKYPALEGFCLDINIDKVIIKKIDAIVDEKGQIRDDASPALQEIRKEKAAKERAIFTKIKQALTLSKEKGYTEENVEPTVRDGRLVIPVLTAYKRNVPGFIHDESVSGRITYIEPTEAFNLNNEIRDLLNAEKREIIKILTAFTNMLRPNIEMLIHGYGFLGMMDFIRAKASFAITIGGIKPDFREYPVIDWNYAVHPLLYLLHSKQHKTVVPLTISLNKEERILVISGPNAGGKSICLKTVGLLQYMWQCGLLVPMKENSIIGIFHHIFIDIGDQQSLENDLSTYSSHLLNMKSFMEKSDAQTLFLIDEFGAGTEPNLGGSIAEAVLEELNRKESFGVVTTHYANLKLLSEKCTGIVNGAMLFDITELKPLFKLKIGKPGSSFAFEIAKKIGFPKRILSLAEEKIGTEQVNFDQQLQQLEIEKEKIEKGQRRLSVADEFLNEMIEKYTKLNQQLEHSRKEILNAAKAEAKQILAQSNQIIEKTIREIRESGADKEITKQARREIADYKEGIAPPSPPEGGDVIATHGRNDGFGRNDGKNKGIAGQVRNDGFGHKDATFARHYEGDVIASVAKQPKQSRSKEIAGQARNDGFGRKDGKVEIDTSSPIKVGDFVRLQETTTIGKVVEIKNNQALITFDSVSMRLEINKLEKIKAYQPPVRHRPNYAGVVSDLNERKAQFSTILDLRGIRAEEALQMTDKYIDEAALLSIKQLRILHGKGNGILRNLIRGMLAKNSLVEQFEDEFVETGGQGITLVRMK